MAETGYTKNLLIKTYNQSQLANDTSGLDWTLAINGDNADSMAQVIDEFAGKTNETLKSLTNESIKDIMVNGKPVPKINSVASIDIPENVSELKNDVGYVTERHDHTHLTDGISFIAMPNKSGTIALTSDIPPSDRLSNGTHTQIMQNKSGFVATTDDIKITNKMSTIEKIYGRTLINLLGRKGNAIYKQEWNFTGTRVYYNDDEFEIVGDGILSTEIDVFVGGQHLLAYFKNGVYERKFVTFPTGIANLEIPVLDGDILSYIRFYNVQHENLIDDCTNEKYPYVDDIKCVVNPYLECKDSQNSSYIMFETKLYEDEVISKTSSGIYEKNSVWGDFYFKDTFTYSVGFPKSQTPNLTTIFVDSLMTGQKYTENYMVKYDGTVLREDTNFNTKEGFCFVDDTKLYISIPDELSGWGTNYTPTEEEIKAFFLGWKMYDASNYGIYDRTDGTNKAWAKLWCSVNNKSTTITGIPCLDGANNISLVCPTTMNDMGYIPYKLLYKKENPINQEIKTYGELIIKENVNILNSSGLVLREPVKMLQNPYFTRGGNDTILSEFYRVEEFLSGSDVNDLNIDFTSGTNIGEDIVRYGKGIFTPVNDKDMQNHLYLDYLIYKSDTIDWFEYDMKQSDSIVEALTATQERLLATKKELDKLILGTGNLNYESEIAKLKKEIKKLGESVGDGKKEIATAITDKGVATTSTLSFKQMADNIRLINSGGSSGNDVILELASKLPDLPYPFYGGGAVILNDEIHILGSYSSTGGASKKHYKLSKTTGVWEQVSTLPVDLRGSTAVTLDNEIHFVTSSLAHYKLSKTTGTWEQVSTIPYNPSGSGIVVLDGEIHILGGGTSNNLTMHHKLNKVTNVWEGVTTLPYQYTGNNSIVVDGEIHILGSKSTGCGAYHYKLNKTTNIWEKVSNLPYSHTGGRSVVVNGEIHIMGSVSTTYTKNWYRLDKTTNTWIKMPDLPYASSTSMVITFHGEIYMVGGHQTALQYNYYRINNVLSCSSNLGIVASEAYNTYEENGIKYCLF